MILEKKRTFLTKLWFGKYSKYYGTFWFICAYSLILYVGSEIIFNAGCLLEGEKRWPSYLLVSSIVIVSSLLSKMLQYWLHTVTNNCKKKGNNIISS